MRIVALHLLLAIAAAGGVVSFQRQPETTAPEIEVVSHKWVMYVFKPGVATGPAIGSETIQKSERVNDPMPVIVPIPDIKAKPIERRSFIYSAEILNRGQKVIKGSSGLTCLVTKTRMKS